MKAGSHHPRHVFSLNPEINSHTVCELYSAVKGMSDANFLRAGEDVNGICIYSTKKTNKLAALTYKSASLSAHRKAMQDLIYRTCDKVAKEPQLDSKDLRALADLSWEASNSAINSSDIPVGRIKAPLKHLNNRIKRSERMRKAEELKFEENPHLKSMRDYLTLFTKLDESELKILHQALFRRDKSVSIAEQKIILRTIFVLINAYLTQSGQRKTLAQMIRQCPQPDMLLKFADAWLAHVEGHKTNHPNLLVTFSWQKTITRLAETIRREIRKTDAIRSLYVSPARAALIASNVIVKPASPTKFPQDDNQPRIEDLRSVKVLAPTHLADVSPQAVIEEATFTSLPSLPDIPDLEEIIVPVSDDTGHEPGKADLEEVSATTQTSQAVSDIPSSH
jgi:hypothetical protein